MPSVIDTKRRTPHSSALLPFDLRRRASRPAALLLIASALLLAQLALPAEAVAGSGANAAARPQAAGTTELPAGTEVFLQPDLLSPVILVFESAVVVPVVGSIDNWYQIFVPTPERGVMRIGYVRRSMAGEFVPAPPRTITAEDWYPLGVPESETNLASNQLPATNILATGDWGADRFDIGAKVGFLSLTGEVAADSFGTGFAFGGDLYGWTESGFGGGVSVEYFDKTGSSLAADPSLDPVLDNTALRVVPVTVPFMYRSMMGRFFPYAGGGPGFTYWELRDAGSGQVDPDSATTKNVALAWFVLGGVQVRASGFWVFVEAKFRSDVATAVSPDLNTGGFNLYGGIRF